MGDWKTQKRGSGEAGSEEGSDEIGFPTAAQGWRVTVAAQ
jgi:hypothetical protein